MLDKIKKHKLFICTVVFILIIGAPLIIHLLFKIDAHVSFFQAEWTAGEILQYYASMLSLIPTTLLSIAALNYTINSKRNDDKWERKVFISVSKGQTIDLYLNDIYSKQFVLEINFMNLGDNIPEYAVLRRMTVYDFGNFETVQIPCYRKTFSKVEILDGEKFKIIIEVYDYPEFVFRKECLEDSIKMFERGIITDDELEKETSKSIELEIGLYCGNIVTPIRTSFNIYLQSKTNSNIYHYKCEDYLFRVGTPIEEDEYEKLLELERI